MVVIVSDVMMSFCCDDKVLKIILIRLSASDFIDSIASELL